MYSLLSVGHARITELSSPSMINADETWSPAGELSPHLQSISAPHHSEPISPRCASYCQLYFLPPLPPRLCLMLRFRPLPPDVDEITGDTRTHVERDQGDQRSPTEETNPRKLTAVWITLSS